MSLKSISKGDRFAVKVLLVNGAPHEHGCTYTALNECAVTLREEGVEAEIYWINQAPLADCRDCRKCVALGKCVIEDQVNEFVEMSLGFDGFVFGTAVHFAGMSGKLKTFMDRVFFSGGAKFRLKPAAAVVSARRSGCVATFDQINHYFTLRQMPIIPSRLWNNIHGYIAEDAQKDIEGLQIMRYLARNMVWFLKCKYAGEMAGISYPEQEPVTFTHFIR
jgi:multimeric flavodoxin WrbA